MKLTLRLLSPVHIGTGENLDPFDYYFHGQKVLVLDHEACMDALLKEAGEDALEKFTAWIEKNAADIDRAEEDARRARRQRDRKGALDKNQRLSKLRSEFNIIHFVEKILGNTNLADQLKGDKKFHRYSAGITQRPRNVYQLKPTIKSDGKPYIPGSSIKGAIRSALAYYVIRNLSDEDTKKFLGKQDSFATGLQPIVQNLKSKVQAVLTALQKEDRKNLDRVFKDMNRERRRFEARIGENVEKFIFGCGYTQNEAKQIIGLPFYDLMRIVQVGDAIIGNHQLRVGELKSFTYNRKFERINAQPVAIAEYIDRGSEFEFALGVHDGLVRTLGTKQILDERKDFAHFAKKFDRLFGFKAAEATAWTKEQIEGKIYTRIVVALQEMGAAIRRKEETWLEQFGDREVSSLTDTLKSLDGAGATTKLGFGSGWYATTVGLALQENPHIQKSALLQDIIYVFNLDLIINQERALRWPGKSHREISRQMSLLKRLPDSESFPRSRRLLAANNIPEDYLGWVAISNEPLGNWQPAKTENEDEVTILDDEDFDDALDKLKQKFGQ